MSEPDPESPEALEEYFAVLKSTFLTEGWIVFQKELLEEAKNLDSVQTCKDSTELHFRRGQLSILGNILNLEENLQKSQDHLEETYYEGT